MKRFLYYLMVVGVVVVSMTTGLFSQEKTSSTSDEPVTGTVPTQTTSAPSPSFKSYPDHSFHLNAKEYINGMQRGGHNLLIWRDLSVDLSQYSSVKITEFGDRLLPRPQNVFSYDSSFITLFNSAFRLSLELPQKESPDALLIEGAVVECNPGSQTVRYLVGFGAGKAAGAVVCEVYEPGKTNPCIRIYTRDTGSIGTFGGDSEAFLNRIFKVIAMRLANTLNSTIGIKSQQSQVQRQVQTPPQTTSTYKGQVVSASEYNSRGFEYYKNAQYKLAIEDFTVAISMENNSSYYINRGSCFYQLKQYDKAISDFEQAIDLAPNKATPYAMCGNVYYLRKSYYNASEYYSKAITITPSDAVLYLNRGYTESKVGNKSRAVSDFRRACKLGNEDGCKELKVLEKE